MHVITGIAATALLLIQLIVAAVRPGPNSALRPIYNWVHWLFGMSAWTLASKFSLLQRIKSTWLQSSHLTWPENNKNPQPLFFSSHFPVLLSLFAHVYSGQKNWTEFFLQHFLRDFMKQLSVMFFQISLPSKVTDMHLFFQKSFVFQRFRILYSRSNSYLSHTFEFLYSRSNSYLLFTKKKKKTKPRRWKGKNKNFASVWGNMHWR